jgi:hypothetical protein
MKTSSTMVFFGTAALAGAIVLGSSLPGCRNDGSQATGGNTTSSSGTGGTSSDAPVGATLATIQQLTNPTIAGHVGAGVEVQVNGAVAMSPKFLVSKSKSTGSCLWGVFLSAPSITQTDEYTGILALSYGTPAIVPDGGTTAYCPVIQDVPGQPGQPAGDAFPDDVAPGDIIDVMGKTDAYIYAGCTAPDAGPGASTVSSIQLNNVTLATRHAGMKATVPTPAVLSAADVASYAAGSDSSWFAKWGSVRVTLDDVTVIAQSGALTDSYGHMLIQQGSYGIQVGDSVYYVGDIKTRDVCYGGPVYPLSELPLTFTSMSGFVYLDFCNWALEPSSKCADLNPPSPDCINYVPPVIDAGPGSDAGDSDAGESDAGGPIDAGGPVDAGAPIDAGPNPAVVCTH